MAIRVKQFQWRYGQNNCYGDMDKTILNGDMDKTIVNGDMDKTILMAIWIKQLLWRYG